MPLIKPGSLTADERSFRNAKPGEAFLISYKAFADLAGKVALFVITIVAARRLSPQAFGVFSLGSTLGWIVAVTTDFGIQLHLARAVARRPQDAAWLLASWLRVRLWTAAGAMAVVLSGLLVAGWRTPFSVPIAVLALVYACSGLIELLHYFYRGLSRSDVESSLTLWQRSATLVCGLIALAWWPDVTVLACAMLLPVLATLAFSVRLAARLSLRRPEGLHYDSRGADDHSSRADLQVRPSGEARSRPPDLPASARGPDARSTARLAEAPEAQRRQVRPWTTFRRDVWPIGAGIVLSALYFRIDVFLIQAWLGTESVARYNAVFRLVEALRLFPAAVLAVVLPSLCRAGDLRPLMRVAVPITGCAAAVAGALWAASGWLVPFVYGAPYASAVPAFRILLLSFPLMSLNFALTHQLVGWNGQRAYAAICALALVVNVLMNSRLVPAWSIEGAAWATLGTELFLTAGCVFELWFITARASGAVAEDVVMG
jgi:O-antigen/teichoic acid export membrane protein